MILDERKQYAYLKIVKKNHFFLIKNFSASKNPTLPLVLSHDISDSAMVLIFQMEPQNTLRTCSGKTCLFIIDLNLRLNFDRSANFALHEHNYF